MSWFFALLVVAILGATAVVAAGRGGGMVAVHDDRPDPRLPAEGPVTSESLRAVRFTTALRGYRAEEVDALLERLAVQLQAQERSEERRA